MIYLMLFVIFSQSLGIMYILNQGDKKNSSYLFVILLFTIFMFGIDLVNK